MRLLREIDFGGDERWAALERCRGRLLPHIGAVAMVFSCWDDGLRDELEQEMVVAVLWAALAEPQGTASFFCQRATWAARDYLRMLRR